jgi:hypothetical protein
MLEVNITALTDEEATQQGIRTAIDVLVSATGQNDIVVICYSGHGSQVQDGSEAGEPSGLDTTIVPYGNGRGSLPLRDITDDEILCHLCRSVSL